MKIERSFLRCFPDKRTLARHCLQKTFSNPLMQKCCDFLVENNLILSARDNLIPLFEASETVREKIRQIAHDIGIINCRDIKLHEPRRTNNPHDEYRHPSNYISAHSNNIDSNSELPSELDVFFLSPSNYRDEDLEGFSKVRRYKLGLLPQTANRVLEAQTPSTIDGTGVKVMEFDDKTGEGIPVEQIVEHALMNPDKKIAVCLTGIQTNQYPRALDIALKLKTLSAELGVNIEVLMGGPHIRSHNESFEKLEKTGLIPVSGEMEEGRFADILSDILHDKTKESYSYDSHVNVSDSPLPQLDVESGYASPVVTLQLSRGCPHKCSFCSVKNFDGKRMRYRSVEEVEVSYCEAIEKNIETLFITDDNFLRNKNSKQILKMMAKIRRETGSNIKIMFQSDIKIEKDGEIDNEYMQLCKEAGVYMIFFGQESYDPEELIRLNKKVNLVHIANSCGKDLSQLTSDDIIEYTSKFVRAWKENGVATNLTSIIGLPGHKPGIGREIAQIAKRMDVDIVSPYIFTLLPGSDDYYNYVTSGQATENRKRDGMKTVDLKFNNADSVHPNVEFENGLNARQQTDEFYSLMRHFYKLSRIRGSEWDPTTLSYYLHHCLAAALKEHPMSMGILRMENTEYALTEDERNIKIKSLQNKMDSML